VLLNIIFGGFAVLSLILGLWQWVVARRFPLHQPAEGVDFAPGVTLLKPLKGADEFTEACLRSWFAQEYVGPVQLLFGVASAEDPVVGCVERLMREFPKCDAKLVVCGPLSGSNLKVAKLAQLETLAQHEFLVVSDADVQVPAGFLSDAIKPMRCEKVGLVNCFYRLANPSTLAMDWEAVAINADFWSQVLQSKSLKPLDFALGAVMAVRRAQVRDLGGFAALAECLADDYQLGNRIARAGGEIVVISTVVDCYSGPMGWEAVWKHQLRWARTIRVCQPVAYFFSILSNASLWPLLWIAVNPGKMAVAFGLVCGLARVLSAMDLQQRLARRRVCMCLGWMPVLKDLLQFALWLMAFAGNHIEWRGERMHLRSDGTLVRLTGRN
jgi:ceramide glucosyltransferase